MAHQVSDGLHPPDPSPLARPAAIEPALVCDPPSPWHHTAPDASLVQGRDVWLVHPWSLGALPTDLPPDTLVVGITVSDFHKCWPWSPNRWHFVEQRMADIAALRWHGEASAFKSALEKASSVRCVTEPHLAFWLAQWAACTTPAPLFAPVDPICHSFSQWWKQASPHRPSALA